jgi:ABC-2 type transport system permease protein
MREYWTLTRRELGGYFLALTGYIIMAAAVLAMGVGFWLVLSRLQGEAKTMPVIEWWSPCILLIATITTPLITMRLFAVEKATGTIETLMTAPVTERQVVLAKFSAAMIFYATMWLPLLGCAWVVRHYAGEVTGLDQATLASVFVGVLLFGAVGIAFGCCASAMTRSQVVAAVLGFVFGFALLALGIFGHLVPTRADWQSEALAALAFFEQMHDFSRGIIDTRAIVLYLSLALFFLFVTLRVVESRRWK